MSTFGISNYPLPDLSAGALLAELPIEKATDGVIGDRQTPCDPNDQLFADWDTPLVWHHQKSQVKVSKKFRGLRAVHFAFEDRVPKDVWDKNWTLWYDHALVTRKMLPPDLMLTGTFAMEELATGMGSDNMEHQCPWVGIVARMQDLRRYYFLALEAPGRVVLYRRDDHQWTQVAWAQAHFDIFQAYRLTLTCRGSNFKAWINDHFLFSAADYGFPASGYCGVRATCVSFVTDFSVRSLPGPWAQAKAPVPSPLPALAAPKVAIDLDLSHLGPLSKTPRYHANLLVGHFADSGRLPQLLVKCFGHPEGANYALVDLAGTTIWSANLPGSDKVHPLPPRDDGTCDLIVVGAEMYRVDGRTGRVTASAPLPAVPGGGRIASGNSATSQADLDGDGVLDTFFLNCGANSPHMWAIGHDLAVRWYLATASGQGHGGHLAACDVDGDGREEVLAGGSMIGPDGVVRWVQHEVIARLLAPNAGHVDSSEAGYFDGPDGIPTVHYLGSSAGHIVLDARTGELIAAHPQGHAQCANSGRVIPGRAGVQVISSNRWGSYGVTAVYDGLGTRLSRFQAGFTSQEAIPINWTGDGLEHLLICDGQGYRGIYDHLGHRLLDLDPLIPYTTGPFEQRFDRTNTINTPITGPCDDLLIRIGNRIRILTADRHFAKGARVYRPIRRGHTSVPAWSEF